MITRIYKSVTDLLAMGRSLSKVSGFKLPDFKGNINTVGKNLQQFLNTCLEIAPNDKAKKILNFFIENFPIRNQTKGELIKVGPAEKKKGGRLAKNRLIKCLRKMFPCWKTRLFVLTSEGLAYCNHLDDEHLKDSMFLDSTLEISSSNHSNSSNFIIVLKTSSRKMKIRLPNILEGFGWLYSLTKAIERSRYCKVHRFCSFAPHCENNYAKWYINGEEYFSDLADALKKATSKIYIAGWMLSPGFYLIRPAKPDSIEERDQANRLDRLLLSAATRGCKIHVLLYKEFDHALPNNSQHARDYLEGLHKNISVLRHPGALTMLWSHHEKLVIIDQAICFMGGLDICFGRFDCQNYPLSEDHKLEKDQFRFPGQDYYNVRIKDFKNVEQWGKTLIDRNSQPRMPWRDIGVQLRGEIVKDSTRHFIQYWNFVKVDLSIQKSKTLVRNVSQTQISGGVSPMAITNKLFSEEMLPDDGSKDSSERSYHKSASPQADTLRLPTLKITKTHEKDLSPSSSLNYNQTLLQVPRLGTIDTKEEDIRIIKTNFKLDLRDSGEKPDISRDQKKSPCGLIKKQKTNPLEPSYGDSDEPNLLRTLSTHGEDSVHRGEWLKTKKTLMEKLIYIVQQLER